MQNNGKGRKRIDGVEYILFHRRMRISTTDCREHHRNYKDGYPNKSIADIIK